MTRRYPGANHRPQKAVSTGDGGRPDFAGENAFSNDYAAYAAAGTLAAIAVLGLG
jgi:hypothetical protein